VLQYVAPTLQLACAIAVFGEPFGEARVVGFACIWLALVIYAVDGVMRSRRASA
jgi:chloramphenicol-sensitive protein RarD